MKDIDDRRLAAFVVWQPKRRAKESDVYDATATFPDPRARHWWDGAGWTLAHFKSVLGISVDAWDVYLLYGPDARWNDGDPPRPTFWMHQLSGVDNGPLLDPEVFAERIRRTLALLPR